MRGDVLAIFAAASSALMVGTVAAVMPYPDPEPPAPKRQPFPTAPSRQLMVASWYGPRHAGNRTASGAIFDPSLLTAAHRTLPFGTRLRLSVAGRSCIVTINDRGPFIAGRDLDVSAEAAQQLGMVQAGVAIVEARVL